MEQEDQRLKKHYNRWMDIVWSVELESCILTKLTKPSVPVNLVGPQVSLPLYWVLANMGSIHFLCVIRRHFLACEDIAGGSELSATVMIFSRNTEAVSVGPRCQVEEIIILRVIRRHFLACECGPSCRPLHVQSTSDACRSLTTLTRPC